jgi:inhibitor of cysteine peptidase
LTQFVLSDKYAYSTAEWEHKAFLFSKEKNLLVVPASYYDWEHPDNQDSYNGALVFYVKRDDFGGRIELRGIVNHVLSETDDFWSRAVERSLYIDNLLYTKSSCLLRINTLAQLNPVLNLDLNCAYEQPILYSSSPAVDIPISLAPPSVPTI